MEQGRLQCESWARSAGRHGYMRDMLGSRGKLYVVILVALALLGALFWLPGNLTEDEEEPVATPSAPA